MMYGDFRTVDGACGVGVISEFGTTKHSGPEATSRNPGGASWLCAGFIYKNDLSDKMFKELNDKYKLVFQTPVRINVNSGNPFYFAVFDTEGSGVPTGFDDIDELDGEY